MAVEQAVVEGGRGEACDHGARRCDPFAGFQHDAGGAPAVGEDAAHGCAGPGLAAVVGEHGIREAPPSTIDMPAAASENTSANGNIAPADTSGSKSRRPMCCGAWPGACGHWVACLR